MPNPSSDTLSPDVGLVRYVIRSAGISAADAADAPSFPPPAQAVSPVAAMPAAPIVFRNSRWDSTFLFLFWSFISLLLESFYITLCIVCPST